VTSTQERPITEHSALLDTIIHGSDFSLKDKQTMVHLMQKLNYMTHRSSTRHGLAMGIAKSLCKQLGELDHKVIPKLNKTYAIMHNLSRVDISRSNMSAGNRFGALSEPLAE